MAVVLGLCTALEAGQMGMPLVPNSLNLGLLSRFSSGTGFQRLIRPHIQQPWTIQPALSSSTFSIKSLPVALVSA